jgi:CRP/FNR family cyclic AMP-dependent transcriptional regulator
MPAVADPRTLAEFELFHDLLPEELVRLNALLHRTTFAPGTTLMTEEQPGEVAYLIVAGTVEVQAIEELPLRGEVAMSVGGSDTPWSSAER